MEEKENKIIKFIDEFKLLDSKFNAYLFPYFHGDISLFQIYVNIVQKEKSKGFFGFFKKKKKQTIEDVQEEASNLFSYGVQGEDNYVNFIQKYTEQA